MAKPASVIGGVMLAAAIFLTVVINVQLVQYWLWLVLVPAAGFFAGIALGAATSNVQPSASSDFMTYTGLFGAGVVLINLYFWLFSEDSITAQISGDTSFQTIMWLTLVSGLLTFMGTTLVALPDKRGY